MQRPQHEVEVIDQLQKKFQKGTLSIAQKIFESGDTQNGSLQGELRNEGAREQRRR